MNRPRLLTIADAAVKARVSERTIGDWVRDGLLTAIPEGRRKLIREDHLEQLMRDRYSSPGRRIRRHARDQDA